MLTVVGMSLLILQNRRFLDASTIRPHAAPFDLLVANERPLLLLHDLLSSSRVRDFVDTAGADVRVGANRMACAIPTGDFRNYVG